MHTQSVHNEQLKSTHELFEYIKDQISHHLTPTLVTLIIQFPYAHHSLLTQALKCLDPVLGHAHPLTYNHTSTPPPPTTLTPLDLLEQPQYNLGTQGTLIQPL